MNGTYLEIDGSPALHFERSLPHSAERVWRAITDPAEIQHWFPAAVDYEPRVGAPMSFRFDDPDEPPTGGKVTELDPPRLFAFDWGEEQLRFELEPADDGCRLLFTHFLSESIQAARDAAGWEMCLQQLDRLLAGEDAEAPGVGPTPEWRDLYDKYVEEGLPSGAEIPGSA
jgi:uncharacterized protein YndB with AHSA1/START domain